MHRRVLGETHVENPLSQAVRLGRVEDAKRLITVTLPASCKKYDEKCGGKRHYLYYGVNHTTCTCYPMHNTWTLNYLGEKDRQQVKLESKLEYTVDVGKYRDQKWYEERQAEVAREKLLEPNGTFDFFTTWGQTPLEYCIEKGERNRFEMAVMLLELGARIPRFHSQEWDPLGIFDQETLLTLLEEGKSFQEMGNELYRQRLIVIATGFSMEHDARSPLSMISSDIIPKIVENLTIKTSDFYLGVTAPGWKEQTLFSLFS